MGSGAAIRAAGKLTGMGVLNVPPTLQEDKDATADLKEVLDKFCLSSSDSSGSKLASVSSSAFSAFTLLRESPAVQSVVASIVADDKVWDSVMGKNNLKEFMVSQRNNAAVESASEPITRVVFDVPPTLQEAKDTMADLKEALDKFCLSSPDSSGSKLAPVSSSAFSAFTLLSESPAVQSVVASIAADDKVWDSVMGNNDLKEFMVSQRNNAAIEDQESHRMFDESSSVSSPGGDTADGFFQNVKKSLVDMSVVVSLVNDNKVWDAVMENNVVKEFMESLRKSAAVEDQESHRMFDESSSDSSPGGDTEEGKDGFFQNVKKSVVEMVSNVSDFFQNLFGSSPAERTSADAGGAGENAGGAGGSFNEKTMGASLMGLAIMVIMVVVLKRV